MNKTMNSYTSTSVRVRGGGPKVRRTNYVFVSISNHLFIILNYGSLEYKPLLTRHMTMRSWKAIEHAFGASSKMQIFLLIVNEI